MGYLEQYKATVNPDFVGRVAMCARKLAGDVRNEAVTTELHQSRVALAAQIDQGEHLADFVQACIMNPTIAATLDEHGLSSAADTDLEWVCSSVWGTLAESSTLNGQRGITSVAASMQRIGVG